MGSPNHSSRRGASPEVIVIHHTGPGSVEGILSWLGNPKSQVSYHYLVDRDGEVIEVVDPGRKAWHAGTGHIHGVRRSVNECSIGVGLVNRGDGEPYPPPQIDALVGLVRKLRSVWRIQLHNILGHRDVAVPVGRKLDPSDAFDWDEFLLRVIDDGTLSGPSQAGIQRAVAWFEEAFFPVYDPRQEDSGAKDILGLLKAAAALERKVGAALQEG